MPLTPRIVNIGPTWLCRREIGTRSPIGTNNNIYKQLYSVLNPITVWEDVDCRNGGVFSLEFSPDGSLLVAACEKRNVMLLDPLVLKPVFTIDNAHDDCVNCVKFINPQTFATGSDDYTVALWDTRNLSQKLRTLQGHDNWVKSIEYAPASQMLVTSGFDGNVLTWDLSNSESSDTKVFSMNGLMRTRLTPDCSKLLICTTAGYIIVVHNLDLSTLENDLDSFKPNMYRLMQLSQTILPGAGEFTHMFRGSSKRNRVDFICDFPEGDDAEVISSIQSHPDGHSVVSRNVSNDEKTEWTCVHNIEERLSSDDSGNEEDSEQVRWPSVLTAFSTQPSFVIRSHRPSARENDEVEDLPDLSVAPSDVWEAVVAIQDARLRRQRDQAARDLNSLIFQSEGGNPRQASTSSGMPMVRRSPRVTPATATNGTTTLRPSSACPINLPTRSNGPSPSTSTASPSLTNGPTTRRSAQLNEPPSTGAAPEASSSDNRGNSLPLPVDSLPSTANSPAESRGPGIASVDARLWTLRRTSRAVSPASSSSSSSAGQSTSLGTASRRPADEESEGNFGEGGEGTSREGSGESSPETQWQRRLLMRQRRSKRLQLARSRRSLRLRTNYEMNETTRIQSLRQRALQFRKRWRVPPRQAPEENRGDHVIFMSIFRETGPRGERGTSMHRHNIAALTVSSEDGAASATPRPSASTTQDLARVRVNKKIHQNIPRLTHYVEEPNVGRGFIKEICFSPDGRILCSPFGNGIRLLAFSPDVQDLRHCYPQSPPVPLLEIAMPVCHSNIVVSTKFSPLHHLLASGCLSGKICLYQPFRK